MSNNACIVISLWTISFIVVFFRAIDSFERRYKR